MGCIRGLKDIGPNHTGRVLTIGNFDGVHLGHQYIIDVVNKQKNLINTSSMAMIFEPHPMHFFKPDVPRERIFTLEEKVNYLQQYGIDDVLVLDFDASLAKMSADEFIEEILVKRLAIKHCVVGHDFKFGKARQGNAAVLADKGEQFSFGVECLAPFLIQEQRVSSTAIRAALATGDITSANEMLGHLYVIEGTIEKGSQRGREFGFPTANIYLRDQGKKLGYGIYTVTATSEQGVYPGVASFGVRPAVVADGPEILEVHCLDIPWTDFYGEKFVVEFHEKIRDEQNFDSIDDLIQQMHIDCDMARHYFSDKKLDTVRR